MRTLAAIAALALVLGASALAPGSVRAAELQQGWESSKTLEEVSAICVSAFRRAAAESDPQLTSAIKSCASLDEWVTASDAFPDALSGAEPLGVAVSMCVDESLGLGPYTLCHDVRTSLIGGDSAGGIDEATLRSACQADAADRAAFEACLERMRSILGAGSPSEAYLAISRADTEARKEATRLLQAAGRDTVARSRAWAANAARNEAFIATVAALDLPGELRPQIHKLIARSRLVASLERMLSRYPWDRARVTRWKAAVEARRKAALELRRVLGIPSTDAEPTEQASAIDIDLVFRGSRFRKRVTQHIPAGVLTWCDRAAHAGPGRAGDVRWLVIGGDDLGTPSVTSLSYEDADGPGRSRPIVLVDVAAGLDSGLYAWDPDDPIGPRPKGTVTPGSSGQSVKLKIKAVKVLQPDRPLTVKGTITCQASPPDES